MDKEIYTLKLIANGRSWRTLLNGDIQFSNGETLTRKDIDTLVSKNEIIFVKNAKKHEIYNKKKEVQQQPVEVRGVLFFGGREAAQKYDEAFRLAKMMGLNKGNFLSYDSGIVEVDEEYATEVVVAVGAASYAAWAKAQEYIAQIEAATSIEEIQSIGWS